MESTRQQKVSKLILKELAVYLQIEGKTLYPGIMVSVTRVSVTSDLSVARVHISIFPTHNRLAIFESVTERAVPMKRYLSEKIKKQVRIIPHLEFYLDDSLDYIENIDRLLKQ